MIFFSDLLSGTSFLNTIPISIGAKSALTDTIEESNTGLYWCASGCAGITVVVVEGQEPEGNLSILITDEKGREISVQRALTPWPIRKPTKKRQGFCRGCGWTVGRCCRPEAQLIS